MTLFQASQRGALALGTFALVTAGSVALTRALTAERIETHQLAYQHRQLQEVLPEALANTPVTQVLESTFTLPNPEALGLASDSQGWWVSDSEINNQSRNGRSAVILPVVTRQGYNGEIRLLIGIDEQQRISGVRVTQHQETPGLGDDIERSRSDWITDFNGLGLDSLPPEGWAVAKDGGHFDAFTGATITPRAVVNAVHKALQYATYTPLPITFEESTL
ncbi:RnfABCDGE type electron transport complex subunit G [Vreelandella boliviensis]|uniref:Ion-translocating oxidoreductase complex subunit G n=1 Tax=Vreelandella boliviensis LC1 TaxID=1072583 RepID=A0A265DZU8_9GAMM|nr:RnfABCDGE type electron transport complex subunit G [Halomonas boliviensis]EHJ91619.1 Electron transport complex protein rnfG [Halomonas boliviensis LC1]OZT74837.1 electron transporter RnfG [Halomonas boliviensis LC1]